MSTKQIEIPDLDVLTAKYNQAIAGGDHRLAQVGENAILKLAHAEGAIAESIALSRFVLSAEHAALKGE